jgi:excinuclease ABC subunit C
MQEQAKNSNFEAAARTRDLLISIQGNNEKQLVESSDLTARDFINFSREKNEIIVVRLVFRHGKFIDQNELSMKAEELFSAEEILEKFCWEFYRQVDQLPQEIILPLELPNITQIFQLISTENKQEKLVKIVIPQKGDKIKLLNLAKKNAENSLQKSIIKKTSHQKVFKMASQELQKSLQKEDPLQTIECYDISHFSGQETVASQVVFVDGQPHNSAYRRYKIKSLQAGEIDDFKSMAETLTRRMDKLQQDFFVWEKEQEKISQENLEKEQKEKEKEIIENNKESKPKKDKKDKPKKTTPPEKFPLPDLIVLDGGKGQLSAVLQALKKLLSKDFPFNIEQQIIALAKEQEEVFQGKFEKNEIKFTKLDIPASSSASMLLQRLRDEAHRFAHSYNQNLRKKQAEKSILDEIDGIGGITKKKLLKAFGSPREISQQNDKQLLTILNKKQLENLRKIL